jgi:hypothetical protein
VLGSANLVISQNYLGGNGNLISPGTFSIQSGKLYGEYLNFSFNLATQSVGLNITSPEKVHIHHVVFVGNSKGDLITRHTKAENSEVWNFVNFIENNLTAIFTGQISANARSLLLFRNSLKSFLEISDQSAIAVLMSMFDYEADSSVLRRSGSLSQVTFIHCQFGITVIPAEALKFLWSPVCFVALKTQPGEFFQGIEAAWIKIYIFGMVALFGIIVIVAVIAVFWKYFGSRQGYIMPAGFAKVTTATHGLMPQSDGSLGL